jgi:EpsI family protein
VSNGFRIALVGWLAAHGLGNGDLAASYTHVVEGLVVSAAGYGVILAFLSALARFNKIPQQQTDRRMSIPVPSSSSPVRRRRFLDLGVVGALLMAAPMPLLAGSADVGLTRDLKMLPTRVGNWRAANVDSAAATHVSGVREDLVEAYPTSTGIRRFAGVDNEVSLVYENASSGRLRLYVGYYRHQEEGRELAGETGRLLAKASAPVSLRMGSETVTAREIVRGAEGGLLYWYDIDGRIVSNSYLVKAYTVWDGLTRQRTNGGVIMISWEGARPDGRAEAIAFAGELIPVLQTYFKP